MVVSLIAGFTANSSALIGWGLDSTIEVISAGTLGLRLHGEIKGLDEKRVEKRKMTTSNVDDMTYHDKKTLSNIANEQDRKLKSSKAYKTNQQKIIDTRTIVVDDKTM